MAGRGFDCPGGAIREGIGQNECREDLRQKRCCKMVSKTANVRLSKFGQESDKVECGALVIVDAGWPGGVCPRQQPFIYCTSCLSM